MAMTERQKLDRLFSAVSALHFHTIRCETCRGKEGGRNSNRHLAFLVKMIEQVYHCLDEE